MKNKINSSLSFLKKESFVIIVGLYILSLFLPAITVDYSIGTFVGNKISEIGLYVLLTGWLGFPPAWLANITFFLNLRDIKKHKNFNLKLPVLTVVLGLTTFFYTSISNLHIGFYVWMFSLTSLLFYVYYFNKKLRELYKIIFSVIVLVFFFAIGMYGYRCFFEKVCEVGMFDRFVRSDVTITTPKGLLTAEVADTKSTREQGLSGRPSIKDNEGMLFVFDTPGRYGFWMKDMLFNLDLIWINQNGVVVEIERNVAKDSYPKTFMNASPASYVLEVNAGVAEQQGLFIGSKVKISK